MTSTVTDEELVNNHTVLRAVVGPHACGLGEDSMAEEPLTDKPMTDKPMTDKRGVYVAPTRLYWGFDKPPASVDGPPLELLSWEVEFFCTLALRADPTALEVLASPVIEACTPMGEELRALLPAFLSQRVADSFRRATAQEFARAAAAAAAGGTPRWPQLMAVVRMLLTCERLLLDGDLVLDVGEHRARLLAVRSGDVPWLDVRGWVEDLRDRTVKAVLRTPLPVLPDTAAVERWLISVRRRCLVV